MTGKLVGGVTACDVDGANVRCSELDECDVMACVLGVLVVMGGVQVRSMTQTSVESRTTKASSARDLVFSAEAGVDVMLRSVASAG